MKKSYRLAGLAALTLCAGLPAWSQLKPAAAGSKGSGLALPPAAAPARADAAPPASSANAQKEAEGKLAAQGWLVLLDRRDWGTAWETSAGVFRSTVPLAAWMEGIPKVREPVGAFLERMPGESNYRTSLEGRPNGEYVSVVFDTRFEKRQVEEIVTTVRDPDGKWRVTGYSIQ